MPSEIKARNKDKNNPNENRPDSSNPSLQYPLDLDSEYEGYYIEFSAFNYQKNLQGNGTKVTKPQERIRLPIVGSTESSLGLNYETFEGNIMYDIARDIFNKAEFRGFSWEEVWRQLQNAGTGILNLGGAAGRIVQRNLQTLGGTFEGQLSARSGTTVNPRNGVAFGGASLREHQYSFLMIPTNPKEADAIEEIIKKFKSYSLPDTENRRGYFLNYPKEWNIRFFNAKTGNMVRIPEIPDCFLTSVSVTYNPQSDDAKFFKDDFPASVQMNLGFQESNMLIRSDIEDGY